MMPRRVLVVTPSGHNVGGSEVMLGQFLASAERNEFAVHVLFLEGGDHFEEMKAAGYSCELAPTGRLRQPLHWLRATQAVARLLKTFRPDLVIGWQSKAVAIAGFPTWWGRVPFHCFHRGLPGAGVVDRISYLFPCNGYLANSSFTAGNLRRHTRRPIAIRHSAVDLHRFDLSRLAGAAELKARLGFDPESPLVGIVGRLQRWKGIHVFIDAVARLRAANPRLQAVVVGGEHALEPGCLAALKVQIARLGLQGAVRLVGSQPNVPEWMQAMDVIVHASDQEPFGIVVIEAMSLGKPVVASIPGGPAEVIEDGESGLLVRHGDANALAAAVARFLDDPALAAKCGRRAREAVLRYDGTLYARQVIEAIDELRAEGRPDEGREAVLFSSLPEVGGHTTTTLKLCEMMRDMGLRLTVVVKDMPGHGYSEGAAEDLVRMGAKLHHLPEGLSPAGTIAKLAAVLGSNFRPELLLAVGMRHFSPLLAVALAPRRAFYFHTTHELSPEVLSQLAFYRRFLRLIFISPATCEDYRRLAPGARHLAWAAQPSGLDSTALADESRRPGPPRLGFLGRLTGTKGCQVLLDAIRAATTSCELHVAGRGDFDAKFQQAAAAPGPGRVFFHGAYGASDRERFLREFLSGIDCLCVPTLDDREGVPTVILEALQFGVPVLATNTGGTRSFGMKEFGPAPPEVVQLVPPAELPAALAHAFTREPPTAAVRAQCRDYYARYFSDPVIAQHWRRVLFGRTNSPGQPAR